MSRPKSKGELHSHKDEAINNVENYLGSLIESDNPVDQGKADKLSYWLKDYIKFLNSEKSFDPTKYQKYKKGQIVKVHLGFNIGSEEGGLHYAMVIDNYNSIKSPIINIVPLTSVKKTTDISNIREDLGNIYLGDELYRLLDTKIKSAQNDVVQKLVKLKLQLDKESTSANILQDIEQCKKQISQYNKLIGEISRMKKGSIALVAQITTVSKLRIYYPKDTDDVLSGIRLSPQTMDKVDDAIKRLFTKQE